MESVNKGKKYRYDFQALFNLIVVVPDLHVIKYQVENFELSNDKLKVVIITYNI